jgi:hypothetical protein
MYQKSDATLKEKLVLCGLDNNASLTANKLTLKNGHNAESYSNCSVIFSTTVVIDAANKSEIQLVQKSVRKFADEAKLIKKLKFG